MIRRPRRRDRTPFDGIDCRFVALCDVLGFQSLLAENGIDWINARYRKLLVDVRTATQDGTQAHAFNDSIFMCTEPLPEPWVRGDGTRVSRREETLRREGDAFLAAVAAVVRAGMRHGLPLRGGVAAGPCAMRGRRNALVGQPMVDAYRVERSQDWAGVALHTSCFAWSGHAPAEGFFRHVVPYPVPPNPREHSVDLEWALAWPLTPEGVDPEMPELVAEAVAAHAGGPFEQRWCNTRDFVSHLTAAGHRGS